MKRINNIIKEQCDTGHLYAKINLCALENAMLHLKGEQFKLWIYFAKNAPSYSFTLSRAQILSSCDISVDTYNRGIKALIEKGYLVEDSPGCFVFYEVPQSCPLRNSII